MKTVCAGELNHRITLKKVVIIRDPKTGAERQEHREIATVWSNIAPLSNRKIRTADQQSVIETLLFTLRPRTDIAIDWQIAWKNRVFTVRACDRTQSDRLLITAEADNHD